ncbi:microtubule-severing ATPase [Aureococcus anophagefferens]|nr:microtubule-severing ATPase [Aureococcus anophagefferens]
MATEEDATVRAGCMKIPRKFLESADRAGVAGTDGAAYGHIRGLGGVSYDARAGAAAQHRAIVVEEMLAGDGGSRVTFDDVAVAGVHGVRFFDCSASALLNKFWGESEKIARTLFAVARELAPSIVFMDEIDALMGDRGREAANGADESSRRLKVELLAQMDGLTTSDPEDPKRVIVVAASNLPWELDDAFRRRLERRVFVPHPDAKDRATMLRGFLADVPVAADVDYEALARRTEHYSGADLKSLARDGAYAPVRRLLAAKTPQQIAAGPTRRRDHRRAPILAADLEAALERTRPAASPASLARYVAWNDKFGSQ